MCFISRYSAKQFFMVTTNNWKDLIQNKDMQIFTIIRTVESPMTFTKKESALRLVLNKQSKQFGITNNQFKSGNW